MYTLAWRETRLAKASAIQPTGYTKNLPLRIGLFGIRTNNPPPPSPPVISLANTAFVVYSSSRLATRCIRNRSIFFKEIVDRWPREKPSEKLGEVMKLNPRVF